MSLITPETMREHRATWWAVTEGQRIRATSTMRGQWGWDVTCSCGKFDSKTGGATKRSVQDALFDHRYDAQTLGVPVLLTGTPDEQLRAALGLPPRTQP